MNPQDERHDALERLVTRTLRDQPAMRAPATLEARVAHDIARRAARPWWQRGFMRWPLVARAAFVLVSLAAGVKTVDATAWLLGSLRGAPLHMAGARPVMQIEAAGKVVETLAAAGTWILDGIPSPWLYSTVLAGVALYAMFFGLGAAAYRTLYK
jgi:hypothetical protein